MKQPLFKLQDNKWMLSTFASQTKHAPVLLGDMLINYYAQDSVNKIDSRKFSGLSKKELKDFLQRSDFETEKAKFGKFLSFYGQGALAVIMVENLPQMAFFEVVSYRAIKAKILEICVNADWFYTPEGEIQEFPVTYHWKIEENPESPLFGRVIRQTLYTDKFGKYQVMPGEKGTEFVYPAKIKSVPVRLIRNNPESTPDMINSAQILAELNVLGSEVSQEWEFVKTQLVNLSTMFGQGEKSSKRENDITNGQRISTSVSPNSKFQQQFQTIISGSASLQQLIATISWWEDKALKYSFGGRELESSGTNKHSMQVGMFAQASSEYIQVKKEQRERDYQRFFNEVVKDFINIGSDVSISIENSAFEDGKIQGMLQAEAQKALYESQTAHMEANREKLLADARLQDAKTKVTLSNDATNISLSKGSDQSIDGVNSGLDNNSQK